MARPPSVCLVEREATARWGARYRLASECSCAYCWGQT